MVSDLAAGIRIVTYVHSTRLPHDKFHWFSGILQGAQLPPGCRDDHDLAACDHEPLRDRVEGGQIADI